MENQTKPGWKLLKILGELSQEFGKQKPFKFINIAKREKMLIDLSIPAHLS